MVAIGHVTVVVKHDCALSVLDVTSLCDVMHRQTCPSPVTKS